MSKFFKENKIWIGKKARFLIEKRSENWFVGRIENGLPAIVPYDAQHSVGDSIDGSIIDFHLPGQQLVLSNDINTTIETQIDCSHSIKQCQIVCRFSTYSLALINGSNNLLHIPNFNDLNSFYSSHLPASLKDKEILFDDVQPYHSESFNYLICRSPKKKSSIRIHQKNDKVSVTIVDVLPKQLNVKLADGSRGRIHVVESMENGEFERFTSLNDRFHVNQTVVARVLGTRNIEKTVKHRRPVYELSLRETSIEDLNLSDRIFGFVDKIDDKSKGFWFSLSNSCHGYLPAEFVSEKLDVGRFYPVVIMNKAKNDKGEYFTLSMVDDDEKKCGVVFAKFKEIRSANEFHFDVEKDQEKYLGILMSPDVADVYENFVFWSYLMNVKMPSIINGQIQMKKEAWKFRNRTIRAVVKHEDSKEKRVFLSTRKSRFVLILRLNFVDIDRFQIGKKSSGRY